MEPAEEVGHCSVLVRANATVDEVLDVFQEARYRDRVAIFHFGGHAGDAELLLEAPGGHGPETAHAAGLAAFLGEQRGLELVFLNGCSSQGQVRGLLDAGVPAVIATSQAIDDGVATELSSRFYKSLASGTTLRTAFNEAQAAVRTRHGELSVGTYRGSVPEPVAEERWPWEMHVAPGAEERVERWSLPLAARDPLFGLPSPPERDLPPSPFKHLHFFTRDDAEIFFGRGREIRDLYEAVTLPDTSPIVLLFGATGVGKSSLLDAGLRPRLEASHDVVYERRDSGLGAAWAVKVAVGVSGPASSKQLSEAWHRREAVKGKPLVVILDQLEEAYTRPIGGAGEEMGELTALLHEVFAVRDRRPQGKILLGFRKEWLAEVLRALDAARLPRGRIEVRHLERDGIAEAVSGLTSRERLRARYQLEVESELPEIIADDLMEDRAAAIAPALQILLTKMWRLATRQNPAQPTFTVELYQELKRQGILLDDFIDEQLEELARWRPEVVTSGLALDLLAHHTTAVGTAESRQPEQVLVRYGARPEVLELLQQCTDRYLLTGTARISEGELVADSVATVRWGMIRLAHDTLAPIIRQRFEASNLPGQRAVRILMQRAVEWQRGAEGPPLDEADLSVVEAGEQGMRQRTADEERLVAASRKARRDRGLRRRRLRIAAAVAIAAISAAAVIATWQWRVATQERRRAQDRARVAIASDLLDKQPTAAGLVLTEITRPEETPAALATLHRALATRLEPLVLGGHQGEVSAAAFSPDGRRVVTAGGDAQARLFDSETGSLLGTLEGHSGAISAVAWRADGGRIATASRDGTACLWSATGALEDTLEGHRDRVSALAWSADGGRLITASDDGTARLWDAALGKPLTVMDQHQGRVTVVAFDPEDRVIVTASDDGAARLFDAATGALRTVLREHQAAVAAATFSADGRLLATTSADRSARLWDVASGRRMAVLEGHIDLVRSAVFAPDSELLATASDDGTVRLWDTSSGVEAGVLQGHGAWVSSVAFHPDGRRLVTASWDRTVRLWDIASSRSLAVLRGHTDRIYDVSFSPDGERILSAAADATARLWETAPQAAGVALEGHRGSVAAAIFAPGGERVATVSADRTVRLYDLFSDAEPVVLSGHTDAVIAAAFSPSGDVLATAGRDDRALLWDVSAGDVSTGKLIADLDEHRGDVNAVAFSSDGKFLATASSDGTVRVWNGRTGAFEKALEGHDDRVVDVAWSTPEQRLVSASRDGTARIWSLRSDSPGMVLGDHGTWVNSADFDAQGRRVVTAGDDGIGRLFEVATGGELRVLEGHRERIYHAVFDPSGERVATASADTTVRLWDARTGELSIILEGHGGGVRKVAWSPDGRRVATASDDGKARLFDAASGETVAVFEEHADGVKSVAFSVDGGALLTASADGTARLRPAGAGPILSRIRARSHHCLEPSERVKILGEAPKVAGARAEACAACVPAFFDHLARQPGRYTEPWRLYKQCLERQRP